MIFFTTSSIGTHRNFDDAGMKGTGTQTMTASHALTPITGTNGYQQSIEIDPSEPLHLSVSNASGKVRIVASDQSSVWVVVRRTDGETGDIDEVAMTVNVEGNTISIHPDWNVASGLTGLTRRIRDQLQHGLNPDDWNISKLRLNPDLEYDIRVEIPRALAEGSSVNAKTASGGIEVSGVRGDLTVASASGSSSIADVKGKVSAHTASGRIRLSQVYGSLEANSASGAIHVEGGEVWTALRSASGAVQLDEVRLKNARIVTVSGRVKGNIIADNAADYDFKTVSGRVTLEATVPGTGRTSRLSFRSASGSAKIGGDWRPEGKKTWTLGSGEDGPNFTVKTVSGSLNLTGIADANLTGRSEPLPAFASPDSDTQETPEREDEGRKVRADLDLDIDKTVTWAKDFARSFTHPTPPTRSMPPTPATPATPVTPATPQASPTPGSDHEWVSSDGAGAPPRAGMTHPAVERDTTDTEPLPSARQVTGTDPAESGSEPPIYFDEPADRDDERKGATSSAIQSSGLDAGDSERLRILEALERGEIDIDDALAEIEREESRGT